MSGVVLWSNGYIHQANFLEKNYTNCDCSQGRFRRPPVMKPRVWLTWDQWHFPVKSYGSEFLQYRPSICSLFAGKTKSNFTNRMNGEKWHAVDKGVMCLWKQTLSYSHSTLVSSALSLPSTCQPTIYCRNSLHPIPRRFTISKTAFQLLLLVCERSHGFETTSDFTSRLWATKKKRIKFSHKCTPIEIISPTRRF